MHFSERKRLHRSQRRVFRTGRANLILDLIEIRLELVEFFFQIRRLIFRISTERDAGELLRDLLLPIEIVLLFLEQVGRHAFGNLRVDFTEHVEQRARAAGFGDAERFGRIVERFAGQRSS